MVDAVLRLRGADVQYGGVQGARRLRLLEGRARARPRLWRRRPRDGAARTHHVDQGPATEERAHRADQESGEAECGRSEGREEEEIPARRASGAVRALGRAGEEQEGTRELRSVPAKPQARLQRVDRRGQARGNARSTCEAGDGVDRRGEVAELEVRTAVVRECVDG